MAAQPSGCACADPVFSPIETAMAKRPAKSACCCCQWELRKGVLVIGGFFTVLILAMAVVYLFIPAIAAIWSVFLLVLGLVWGQGVWAVYNRELKGIRINARFQIVFNLVCVILMATIPLWAPAVCASQEAEDGRVYNDDCGLRMVPNTTGYCNPKLGALTGGTSERFGFATIHPDGTIEVDGQVVRECVLASAATQDCGTACCVNPEVTTLRHKGGESCETKLEIAEALDLLWSLIFITYYTWLLNSLIVEFEQNEGASLATRV